MDTFRTERRFMDKDELKLLLQGVRLGVADPVESKRAMDAIAESTRKLRELQAKQQRKGAAR